MNVALRNFLLKIPGVNWLYVTARRRHHARRFLNAARSRVVNLQDYHAALTREDGQVVDIQMKDGLVVAMRRHFLEAGVFAETFFDRTYAQGLNLPAKPLVLDIGGFIGDSALFAVQHLGASRVVVCEPSPKNLALLQRNVDRNGFADRVVIVPKAVTDGRPVALNFEDHDRVQARVSAYGESQRPRKPVAVTTLTDLVQDHALERVNLLKVDCEGSEYDIFDSAAPALLARIDNIIFEYHEIEGYQPRLAATHKKLSAAGFTLSTRGNLVYAVRN